MYRNHAGVHCARRAAPRHDASSPQGKGDVDGAGEVPQIHRALRPGASYVVRLRRPRVQDRHAHLQSDRVRDLHPDASAGPSLHGCHADPQADDDLVGASGGPCGFAGPASATVSRAKPYRLCDSCFRSFLRVPPSRERSKGTDVTQGAPATDGIDVRLGSLEHDCAATTTAATTTAATKTAAATEHAGRTVRAFDHGLETKRQVLSVLGLTDVFLSRRSNTLYSLFHEFVRVFHRRGMGRTPDGSAAEREKSAQEGRCCSARGGQEAPVPPLRPSTRRPHG